MHTLKEKKVALVFAAIFGGWHLMWSVLVALGFAQSLLDFVFRIHMLKPVYMVMPFDLGTAVLLVVVTAIIGYILGWVVAFVWNRVHAK